MEDSERPNRPWNLADPLAYGQLKQFAHEHKHKPTEAEAALWIRLRNRQLGERFRHQYIIDEYIVDFVCLSRKLIIEVDGGYHNAPLQQEADALRTDRLRALGFRVIRFTNEDVLSNIEQTLQIIKVEMY